MTPPPDGLRQSGPARCGNTGQALTRIEERTFGMATQNVIPTDTSQHALSSRTERLLQRTRAYSDDQKAAHIRLLLGRAAALCRMTVGALSQPSDMWPEVQHVAKSIETAQANAEDAIALHEVLVGNSPRAFDTTIDRAVGILATLDAWLWAEDWEKIPDGQVMCASLDAAASVLDECVELTATAQREPDPQFARH